MFPFHPTGGPGDGLFPLTRRVNATNRTGAAMVRGQGCQFDFGIGTDVDDLDPGSIDGTDGDNISGFNNVILPNASSILGLLEVTVFGFQTQKLDAADNALTEICYFGLEKGLVIDATGSPAIGDQLTLVAADGNFDATILAAELILALAREALTTPTAATLAEIFMFGTLLGVWPFTAHT